MNNTNVKPFIFVLMPFNADFDDIYQVGIKAACSSIGAYCERVDEQVFDGNILDRIYNQIAKADLIIAEMTGRNPNVFYETGYAHALNKRVILLTQKADDIPFDLRQYPHIVYGGKIVSLKGELEKRVKWCIDNPKESISKVDLGLEFVINGIAWKEDLELEIPCVAERYGNASATGNILFSLQIGIHNISNIVIENYDYHLSLITPRAFDASASSNVDSVTFNADNAIIRLTFLEMLFPDDWNSTRVNFVVQRGSLLSKPTEIVLRVFSGLGAKDYKFSTKFVSH